MTALDAGIGRIIDQIDELDLQDQTIVVIASDNGASIRENLLLETGANARFRGGRTETYEGGIRTACIVRWPNKIQPGTVCREPVANIELLPMILSAAKLSTTGEIELDGRDPTMTLAGTAKSPHESLFFEYRNWNAVRSGRWKIVRARPDVPFELYDLMIDWKEENDLSQQQPKTVSRLTGLFKQWRDQFPNSPER